MPLPCPVPSAPPLLEENKLSGFAIAQVVDLESEEGGVVTDVVEGAQLWEVEGKQYVLLLTSTLLVCLPLVCSEHR